ncbi:MAG TPA: bifunctional metallophosphatase/5'-nucleotidase [Bacteriovoracaceae bacterium]|nr:bifunctional metallophosphatase/5'-nucleotidase [Bacteriovoracaceae bacterium]
MKLFLLLSLVLSLSSCTLFPEKNKKATLVYFADLHGHFNEHPELFWPPEGGNHSEVSVAGGVARMMTVVNKIKKENPTGVLFMDAGDTIQGAAEVALSEGKVSTPILNAMDIDLAIPGNWEVVYGTKVFKELARKANYPFLASNIREAKTKELVFRPYEIRELNGIRFAIIGYTDPDVPTRQPPSFSEGFIYEGSEVLQPLIDKIKSSHEVDVVVLLTHIGLPKAVGLADKVKGVDIILSSDTHERTYEPIVKGNTWIVEPGAFGSFLGKLDIELTKEGKLKKKWELIELKSRDFKADKKLSELVNKTLNPYRSKLDKKIGETQTTLVRYNVVETSLDAILADALKEATGTDIALSNGFRFAYPIVPGPIVEGDLWSIYPINTQIKTGRLTGKQLKDFYEKEIENVFSENYEKLFGGWLPRTSGLHIKFKVSNPPFHRIQEMTVNGVPLDEKKYYTVTTCVREGDPDTTLCRIPNGKDIVIKDFDAHEAVRRYLKKHWPVIPPTLGRVEAIDLPETVRSQYYRK